MSTGCVILAGGKSTRMGRDKALLLIKEKNFIEHLCESFGFLEERIIAGGDHERRGNNGWTVLSDEFSDCGPIGGLHSALKSCRSEALFVIACDMPMVKKEVFDALYHELEEAVDVVVPVTENECHPLCAIYKKKTAGIIEEQILKGKYRMMDLLKRLSVTYVNVDAEKYGIYNMNTPEEYETFTKNLTRL